MKICHFKRQFFIVLSVIGLHLAALGWLQVRPAKKIEKPSLKVAFLTEATPALIPTIAPAPSLLPTMPPAKTAPQKSGNNHGPAPAVPASMADIAQLVDAAPSAVPPASMTRHTGPEPAFQAAMSGADTGRPRDSENKAAEPADQLPSSDAKYLNNPAPTYPVISQRLGEQGKVLIHILIGKDGMAKQAEIAQSSGFDRLDRAALDSAMAWRYSPGQRAGVAQDMWFNVPLNFSLK